MSLSTYTGLKTAVANLLNRDDLTAYVPDWITMAESELNTRLTGRNMEATQTITITGETYPLPCNWGGVRSFRLNTAYGQPLEYATPDAFDHLALTTGTPALYTISGGNFVFSPPPSGSFTARLRYRQTLPSLAENGENWLLSRFPNAYLYGAAKHSAPFLSDDNRIQVWSSLFDQIVDLINLEARRETEGATLQTRSGISD
jgi:hypothetical protein